MRATRNSEGVRAVPPYDPEQRYEVDSFDVTYRQDGETSWQARMYQPRGAGPFPALLDVHGGAWSQGDRLLHQALNQELAATGLVIAAIDFRLAPEHPYPASIQDTSFATRWLKANAPQFNADAHRLGGLGASSGAHMLHLSAMRPHDPRYSALELPGGEGYDASLAYLIQLWPIPDPYARYLFAKATGRQDLVEATEGCFRDEATMREASPQCILDRGEPVELPPTLILQGTADTYISFETIELFARTYEARGGRCQLEVFPGSDHRFAHEPGPQTDRALRLMKAFIADQLSARRPVREMSRPVR